MQQGFAARATALHQREKQGAVDPKQEQKFSKCCFFLLQSNPTGSETAQCSPQAPRAGLSEELNMACSDLGTKLHFKLLRSSLLATKLIKSVLPPLQLFCDFCSRLGGASDTGGNPFHEGKKKNPFLFLQQTNPVTLPTESCQTQGAARFPSETLCTWCSSLSHMLGKQFGSSPSHFSFFKKMELGCSTDCCSSPNQ